MTKEPRGRGPARDGGKDEDDRQFVVALARGVAILRCFSPAQPELGTSDIARMTALPQPTVWRLCHTLRRLGVLVPGRDPARLRVGFGLLSLGYAAVLKGGVAEAAQPAMQAIADRFGLAVSGVAPIKPDRWLVETGCG
jgi:DNA-binding IclR family transcriptional regulator